MTGKYTVGFLREASCVVLDVETCGLGCAEDRVMEITAIEVLASGVAGRVFHAAINPGVPIPPEVTAITGLADAMLADCSKFSGVADELLAFIGGRPIAVHNAGFDGVFLNAELVRSGREPIPEDRFVDVAALVGTKLSGSLLTLEELYRKVDITASLADAAILSAVLRPVLNMAG